VKNDEFIRRTSCSNRTRPVGNAPRAFEANVAGTASVQCDSGWNERSPKGRNLNATVAAGLIAAWKPGIFPACIAKTDTSVDPAQQFSLISDHQCSTDATIPQSETAAKAPQSTRLHRGGG
jgi:hypothetical protein